MTLLVARRRLSLTQPPITDHLHSDHIDIMRLMTSDHTSSDLETRGHGTLSTPDTGDTG